MKTETPAEAFDRLTAPVAPYSCAHLPEGICDRCLEARLRPVSADDILAKISDDRRERRNTAALRWLAVEDETVIPATLQAPKCALCGAREWGVDHIDGDEESALVCSECYMLHNG